MKKEEILHTLKVAKQNSKKRKFVQSVDLVINLKNIDLKKDKVQSYVTLPFIVKRPKIGAFVEAGLKKEAEKYCQLIVTKEEFGKYKDDKKLSKKAFSKIDLFISQANLMPLVATSFGRLLGSKGKMPDPKIGAVIPPGGTVKPIYDKLISLVKIEAKGGNMIKALVGKEDIDENQIVSNVLAIYENLKHVLPNEKENVKNVVIKLSMGVPVRVGEKDEDIKNKLKNIEENLVKLKEIRKKEAEKAKKKAKKIGAVKEEKKETDEKTTKKESKKDTKKPDTKKETDKEVKKDE